MKTYRSLGKTLDQLLGSDPSGARVRGAGPTRPPHASGVLRAPLAARVHSPGASLSRPRYAEPISLRNDLLGTLQQVNTYDESGRRSPVRPPLKAELRSFARTCLRNLRQRGFLARDAEREVLS